MKGNQSIEWKRVFPRSNEASHPEYIKKAYRSFGVGVGKAGGPIENRTKMSTNTSQEKVPKMAITV